MLGAQAPPHLHIYYRVASGDMELRAAALLSHLPRRDAILVVSALQERLGHAHQEHNRCSDQKIAHGAAHAPAAPRLPLVAKTQRKH